EEVPNQEISPLQGRFRWIDGEAGKDSGATDALAGRVRRRDGLAEHRERRPAPDLSNDILLGARDHVRLARRLPSLPEAHHARTQARPPPTAGACPSAALAPPAATAPTTGIQPSFPSRLSKRPGGSSPRGPGKTTRQPPSARVGSTCDVASAPIPAPTSARLA